MRRFSSFYSSLLLVAILASFSAGLVIGEKSERSLPNYSELPPLSGENNDAPSPTELKLSLLNETWNQLRTSYYDNTKLDIQKLQWGAVKGFVDGLDDPYTVFMTPEESKEFDNNLEGELEGIGAVLEVREKQLTVVTTVKKSPAERAGIRTGDVIYKIEDALAEDMAIDVAISKIRGKKGTKIRLQILRKDLTEPIELTITRDKIVIENVTMERLPGDIFHVSINQFNDHTVDEFGNIVQQILLEKAKGLVLDVRGNGGGFLDTSIDIVSEFIAGKKTAAIIKKRDPTQNEIVQTSGNARLADIPLVVLVNQGSASASEIVAGALQDYKRAVVMGEKTFGKGSVQELSKLGDGSRLRMTIAKWFTPLDRNIDGVGITPDREVEFTQEDAVAKRDPQLEEAVKYLQSRR